MGKGTVFIYKEYNDSQPYSSEIVEVYEKKEDAISRLQSSVEKFFGCAFSSVEAENEFDAEEFFSTDHICCKGNRGWLYWKVEKSEIMGS